MREKSSLTPSTMMLSDRRLIRHSNCQLRRLHHRLDFSLSLSHSSYMLVHRWSLPIIWSSRSRSGRTRCVNVDPLPCETCWVITASSAGVGESLSFIAAWKIDCSMSDKVLVSTHKTNRRGRIEQRSQLYATINDTAQYKRNETKKKKKEKKVH